MTPDDRLTLAEDIAVDSEYHEDAQILAREVLRLRGAGAMIDQLFDQTTAHTERQRLHAKIKRQKNALREMNRALTSTQAQRDYSIERCINLSRQLGALTLPSRHRCPCWWCRFTGWVGVCT